LGSAGGTAHHRCAGAYILRSFWELEHCIPVHRLPVYLLGRLVRRIDPVFFLNRHESTRARWIVLIAFLLASPIALIMMLGGGLLGPLGVLIFPQFPWGIFMGLGSLVGRFASKGG